MTIPLSSSSSGVKRTSEEESSLPKRSALDPLSPDLSRRIWATLTVDDDYKRAENNVVFLNPDNYNDLVEDEGAPDYRLVKVANLVYKAVRDPGVEENLIDVPRVIFEDIKKNTTNVTDGTDTSVWITAFNPSLEPVEKLKKVHFTVSYLGTVTNSSKKKNLIVSHFSSLIRKKLMGYVLKIGQAFFIDHPSLGPLRIRVEKWEYQKPAQNSPGALTKVASFGEIYHSTQLFFTANSTVIEVVEEVSPQSIENFLFTINRVINTSVRVFYDADTLTILRKSWKKDAQPLPLLFPFDDLVQKIRNVVEGKRLCIGHLERISFNSDWDVEMRLSEVKAKDNTSVSNDPFSRDLKNKKIFHFKSAFMLVKGSSDVFLTPQQKEYCTAEELTFEVVDYHSVEDLNPREFLYLSREEVSSLIKASGQPFAENSQVVITINDVKYLVRLKSAYSSFGQDMRIDHLKSVWTAAENTEIKLFANSDLKINIVDSSIPEPLKSIKIKISKEREPSGDMMAMIFGMDKDAQDKIILKEDELKKLFLRSLPKNKLILDNKTFSSIDGKGNNIKFKVDKLQSQVAGEKPYYEPLYQITDETVIEFEGDKDSGVMINTAPKEVDFEGIQAKLIEFGIGGITNEFTDIVSRTLLSRSSYGEHIKKLGQVPSRGLLLYGPPGTGKTLIARRLGDLLGVSKERIKLYSGSQIWNKWVGESEKNVRKMFEDARADFKKFGKESPLHLLIIDEIDAFLQSRSETSQRWETSVVNAFISELDGISSDGADSLDNIIVVGLTNQPDTLDEAVKRPGRLFPHIHIGIPTGAGRGEIFSIYTKSLRENGFLTDDVSMDKLVEKSVGKTGAFIQGVVTCATEYSLKRVWQAKVPVADLQHFDGAKVTMEDFENAIIECGRKKDKKDRNLIALSQSTDMAEIAKELSALGIGGLSKQLLQYLADLRICQRYSRHLLKIKQSISRGLMLYGLSGVGKTQMAMMMKKLYGLEGDRFQYFQASSIWPEHAKDLKKRVKAIVQPAKDAANDLKHEAPLYVVVFDGLDSLFMYKRETETADQSVMNSFMTELNALFEEELKNCHNLVVVGIAHRGLFGISDGVLKSGAFVKHIEMKAPDRAGRKEIFEIYTRDNLLASDVSLDELASMTEERNGAFIEGVVQEATMRSMRRLATQEVSPDAMDIDGKAEVTMRDFTESIKSLKGDESWRDRMNLS